MTVEGSGANTEKTRTIPDAQGKVTRAADGRSALDALSWRHIDLVLFDYRMSGLAEEETVARLRGLNPYSQVILQTG